MQKSTLSFRRLRAAAPALALLLGTAAFASAGSIQPIGDPQIIENPTWLGHKGHRQNTMIIYDSTNGPTGPGTATLLFTNNNPNASFGDDISYTPPGAGAHRYLTGVNVGFVVPAGVSVPDADMLVTFYDTEDPVAAGANPALLDPLGTARINVGAFSPDPSPRGFVTGMVDISALDIFLPDDMGGISVRFVAAGTDDILAGTTITPALSTGTVGPGSNSLVYFYLDGFNFSPLDGIYTGDERIGFGGLNVENNKLWLQIEGAIPEPGTLGLLPIAGLLLGRRR